MTPVLVIHGGAGVIVSESTPVQQDAVHAALRQALQAGNTVLQSNGSSIDAVGAAVVVMEDSPLFNAGRGAAFNHDGEHELDAAVMDGATLRAGSVAGVQRIRNPVLLAREVMDKTTHVMLIGRGAEDFAESIGMQRVDPQYFGTGERWQKLLEARAADARGDSAGAPHHGTVGAVALDKQGHLAAATSTGGTTDKRRGRVGDSPIIGAGTYANSRCAVSATGWGEFFIRAAAAHDICARVEYGGASIVDAARQVVMQVIPQLGGDGGVIALDAEGNFCTPFSTQGMYRGWVDRAGVTHTAIFD